MRKVYVEVYCEISSAYFVHLWIHNYQRFTLLKKKNVESQFFFSDLYATKKYAEIILQAITQPVRLSRYNFFFAIKPFVFRGWNFCLLSTVIVHCTNNEFYIKDFFRKCDQIRSFLRIWSHVQKKPLMKNFIFCTVVTEETEE